MREGCLNEQLADVKQWDRLTAVFSPVCHRDNSGQSSCIDDMSKSCSGRLAERADAN
jgi:hypothetical protein